MMFSIETDKSFFVAEIDTVDDYDAFVKLADYVGGDMGEVDGHNWIFSALLALEEASSWDGTIQSAGVAPADIFEPNPKPVLVVKSTCKGQTYAVTNHEGLFKPEDVHRLMRLRLVGVTAQRALDMASFLIDIIDPKQEKA